MPRLDCSSSSPLCKVKTYLMRRRRPQLSVNSTFLNFVLTNMIDMTLFNDPVFIEVLEKYDESEDEETLREDILNVLKPAGMQ